MNTTKRLAIRTRSVWIWLIVCIATLTSGAVVHPQNPDRSLLGIYVHQHWSYNHPYAARTWTLEDWRGYLDGISRLGFNMVLIWPMLETMPNPLTPSDEANIEKIADVIALAHREFNMRVNLVLCPNVSAKDEVARQYAFMDRPFFTTDDRIDPADPVALGRLITWREELLKPLAAADGLFIIDSDPGGYPHSTNLDFVYLLKAHRKMLNRLRPGIELVYWTHFGWESYGKFYATGELKRGEQDEPREAIALLAKQPVEPWSVASSGFPPDLADRIELGDRVLGFPYGTIEKEPSFPFTLFGGDRAYEGGKRRGARGVLGNSQTHVVQLPNTFAFSRGARGLTLGRSDYVKFADELIIDQGELIVSAWDALQGDDGSEMDRVTAKLKSLQAAGFEDGPLRGLLLGGSARFIEDLILQLTAVARLQDFAVTMGSAPRDTERVKQTYTDFVDAITAWQVRHNYGGNWRWPKMQDALRKLDNQKLNATLDTLVIVSKVGDTPFQRVKNGLADLETFTRRLIHSMQEVRQEMNSATAGNR
jgi:hypothetical protein